ncbi:MAG: hypothetical protein IK115_01775 [Lachnospiraceae bacterium]|nr:hypothetical protein [Lachnospiraceae bacterium]
MPPSHHSSSHHSSSHHSSSHRSSSHSSSRSHSSHSSSHHSYSRSGSSGSVFGTRSAARSSYTAPVVRPRVNQPVGWSDSKDSIRHYRLKNHDYDYYPLSWTAPDGRRFEEGYYDENGQHYKNLFIPGMSMMMVCEYCGNHMMYVCKEGEMPVCTGCGAQFKVDVTDYNQTGSLPASSVPMNSTRNTLKVVGIILAAFIAMRIIGAIMGAAFAGLFAYSKARNDSSSPTTAVSERNRSIYVEEIGRTCYLDGEDWYDSKTECWFWYNDETEPYQWQYWYEGISSDYGDYGWMEYDMDQQKWYIEKAQGDWIVLPEKYDTSALWHFTDEYTNPF